LQLTKFTDIARKLPSPIYKLASQAWIDKEFPRHIFIETTAACQLSCDFCPREKRNEHMDFNLFKEIVDECSKYGVRSFSVHLFGEPLLYPKIEEAIGYIKKSNRRHTILFTTNGILLNKFSKRLLALGVDRIIWSWRKNNFNDETINVLKKIGLIRFLLEETPEGEIEKWEGFRKEVKHLHNYAGAIDTTQWGLNEESNSERYPCYHLWLAPAIRWNGDITICCNDPTGRETIGSYRSGDTISNVWCNGNLNNIRRGHLKGEYKGLCATCNVWKTYPDMFFEIQKKPNHV
jgi:MoaA/NifB/PqqE/SkfB family radical SAM enzyme